MLEPIFDHRQSPITCSTCPHISANPPSATCISCTASLLELCPSHTLSFCCCSARSPSGKSISAPSTTSSLSLCLLSCSLSSTVKAPLLPSLSRIPSAFCSKHIEVSGVTSHHGLAAFWNSNWSRCHNFSTRSSLFSFHSWESQHSWSQYTATVALFGLPSSCPTINLTCWKLPSSSCLPTSPSTLRLIRTWEAQAGE